MMLCIATNLLVTWCHRNIETLAWY